MDLTETFLLRAEVYCFFGIILGGVIVLVVLLAIEQLRNDRSRRDSNQNKEFILQLFHELRKAKNEEMTLEILREIKKEIK